MEIGFSQCPRTLNTTVNARFEVDPKFEVPLLDLDLFDAMLQDLMPFQNLQSQK